MQNISNIYEFILKERNLEKFLKKMRIKQEYCFGSAIQWSHRDFILQSLSTGA